MRQGSVRVRQQRLTWLLTIVPIACLAAEAASAQVFLPPISDPEGRSFQAPSLQDTPPPPAPMTPAAPTLPTDTQERLPPVKVFAREFRFEGQTIVTTQELQALAAPYTGREVTTEDLESLRTAVTLHYVQRGYVTSGAIIPDQAVTDGLVRIQIIEGALAEIHVDGARWLWPSYYQRRIALGAGPPVNIYTLQERLQLLQQDPRVQRINAELRRGIAPGRNELNVRVSESLPFKAWVEFSNHQSPAVRAERWLATIAHESLTGNGDRFQFTYGQSIPMNNTTGVLPMINVSYVLPITAYDTSLAVAYRRSDFNVVSEPFRALGIEGHTEVFSIMLKQPVYRTLNHVVNLGIQGEYLYNKNMLLGQSFDFFAGYQNGAANVAALRFLQDWTYRTQDSIVGVHSRFSMGADVLDATINSGPVADSRYFSWIGQVQGLHRFDQYAGTQLLSRLDLQLTNDRLFPLEQMPIGGRYSVRGYREISLLRDNAFLFSLEPRLPLSRWIFGAREDLIQVAPFFDYARAWSAKGPNEDPKSLMSVGVGLRTAFLPKNQGYFEIYWGYRLRGSDANDPPYITTGNLQDHGVHLQLVLQPFF
ncbi:MAG: ShlB/FhaC/HecB family hemolysin secretion/activation protein [Nitrospira sp.]|nr:ShlB/FhaC/HecB family hemolysin secretion/activation protein [Nitrospira sp.]MBH0183005.1 ShlB/FhaC/HecB family hemolysin secretion/activation protein [Nitrospira sp.]MBH0187026.1 ShlB/FhaC/HecB family hemolysin secretion/activation protein [Nitrospira sp.]